MSSRQISVGLLTTLLSVSCGIDQGPATAFVGATIIDGTGAAPIETGVILVRAGRIEAVGPAGSIDLPNDGERVDVSGKTIIPGLINTHGHIAMTLLRGIADDLEPGYYLPSTQASWRSRVIVARVSVETGAAVAAMRQAVAEIDPDLAVYQVQTMAERLADAAAQPRFNTVMFGIFAVVALMLAMVGVYGVTSYGVSQRVHELGVRIALGAGGTTITWLVVGRALALVGIGVGVGLAVAVGATRFIEGMLFEVRPFDVATFATVAIGLAAVAAVAAYVPARRAARLDPVTALRE
ncbi:MAG: hypothetical protein IH798_00960 [Gemmatimonadetes bacterium]|nr:hypothetical protein [Gemmatimonadota bacterium]